MFFYYAIVFTSLISVALSQHATICDEARLYTFLPDVRDCSAWFFCSDSGPVRGVCSDNLLFNPETRLCDFPENVDCFRCPSNEGLDHFAMSGSCRSFVRCINGAPFQSICEDGLQFNEITGQCDFPDIVNCGSGFRCPAELPVDGSIVAMRDHYNCSVYHLCIGQPEAVRQECNVELHFDSVTNLCTFPELTTCPIRQHPDGPGLGPGNPGSGSTTVAPTTLSTSTASSTITTPQVPTELPTEPTTEPTTTESTTTESTTTESTTTESTTTESTTTEPSTTEPTTTEPSTTEPTTTEPTTTQATSTETTTTELTTPEPTTQEPTTQEPTTQEPTTQEPTTQEPTTPDSTTPEPTTAEPTRPPPVFVCPYDGIHPHPTECSEYFICAANTPHLMRCADGLHFNAASLQCDFPENAQCDLYYNSIDYY